jgi:hypothetical protein
MADRLYLSYWIRGFSAMSMLRHYEQALRLFPFSKLGKSESTFRVYAIEYTEPTLLDIPVTAPVNPESVIASAQDFHSSDGAYELETAWDLWNWDEDWKLAPSRVVISCFGPEFNNQSGEHLRIDFGLDQQFLPGPSGLEGMRMVRANIQSLLRLVHDLDENLQVEHRQLWSESGENFAELLEAALQDVAAKERN